jgi:hypothetical protein
MKNSRSSLIEKFSFYRDVNLWDSRKKIDYEGWLKNFDSKDYEAALKLLNSFTYMTEDSVDCILSAVLCRLGALERTKGFNFQQSKTAWLKVLSNSIFTPVRGEKPSTADSGYIFTRKVREIGIKESQLPDTTQQAKLQITQHPNKNLIFVDDFVGTGSQFRKTWFSDPSNQGYTFDSIISGNHSTKVYYLCLVATKKGKDIIESISPNIKVLAGYVFDETYSIFSKSTMLFDKKTQMQCIDLIKKYSDKLGFADDPTKEKNWQGFGNLGLAIGFFHGTPDATIPLFYHQSENWVSLVRRVS